MKRPFVYISIPFMLGIVFFYFIDISLNFILTIIIFAILFNLLIYFHNENTISGIGMILLFFILGIFLAYIKFNSSELLKHKGSILQLEGIVEEIRYIDNNKGKAIVRIKNIKGEDFNKNISEKMRLTIIGNNEIELYDTIIFNAEVVEPLSNTNPKLYNYKLNLLSNGIFTTATLRNNNLLEVKKGYHSFLQNLRLNFINKIEEVFDKYLSDRNNSLMKSIVLGDYSYIEEDEIKGFRDLGIAHVIAVSGLHIGLISVVIIFTLSFVGINKKISILIALLAIWIYGFIIGMPASVLRANISISLLLISHILAKPYDSINTLSFALLVLLLINPFWCFNLGFQLSFIATFFILYLTPKVKVATIAAQVGILPVLAYYFNRLPIIAVLANLILVPLFTLSLSLSIFLILFSYISTHISNALGTVINIILNLEAVAAEILYSFPFLSFRVPSPDIIEIISYYIVLFLIVNGKFLRKLHKGIVKTIFYYLVLVVLFNLAYLSINDSLSIEFIDVGQGDSILIRTKKGHYLIDTGGNAFGDYDIGENILLPYLEKHGIFNLNGVFITHFHEDHSKSLPYLMDNINIERVYIGYIKKGNELYENIILKAYEKDIPVYIIQKGNHIKLGRNTHIFVLGPSEELLNTYKDQDNELSLCLLLKHFDKEILFTGDIEKGGEKNLIESLKKDVDFLKVPHHGSNTSSSEEFLKSVKAKVGFISVGRNNIYNHPHKEVLDRYEALGIDIYRTDECGLINLILDKEYFYIEGFIKEKISLYDILEKYTIHILIGILYLCIQYLMVKYYLQTMKELERIEL